MMFFSWGRVHSSTAQVCEIAEVSGKNYLPIGARRSYGDSCFNSGHDVVNGLAHNKIMAFDKTRGELVAESGVTLSQIMDLIIPEGLFFEVVPGTKLISLGGAVANDVHGKNHEKFGSFGHSILEFSLLRNGEELICSRSENRELFQATIGGLGLTGFIKWVKFRLRKIASTDLRARSVSFDSLGELARLFADSATEYKIAWIDAINFDGNLKGIFHSANHSQNVKEVLRKRKPKRLPFHLLGPLISIPFLSLYNKAYSFSHRCRSEEHFCDIETFFFPLDKFSNWNEIYPKGFFQIQLWLPPDAFSKLESILGAFHPSREIPALVVLKKFGAQAPEGFLSFPREGFTLSIDLPNQGRSTEDFIRKIYDVALDLGGSIYPCKDQVMVPEQFSRSFPQLQRYKTYKLPEMNSDFWRRVGVR